MSFNINFSQERVLTNFNESIDKNDIKNAFFQVTENVDFENLKHLVLDFTDVISFEIPDNFIKTTKTLTHFFTVWNPEIKVVIIATNKEIRTIYSELIKNGKELVWEYVLFESWDELKKWDSDFIALDQHQLRN